MGPSEVSSELSQIKRGDVRTLFLFLRFLFSFALLMLSVSLDSFVGVPMGMKRIAAELFCRHATQYICILLMLMLFD